MIRNHEEFESALTQLAEMLENPPTPATEEDRVFGRLLNAVDLYKPAIADHPEGDSLLERAHALTDKAEAFQREREEYKRSHSWATFSEDGEGVGPTTGAA